MSVAGNASASIFYEHWRNEGGPSQQVRKMALNRGLQGIL